MAKQKTQSRLTALFDIRLKNTTHDVLLLKGSEHNAASTFVNGKILLSVNEPISVKKISLRLYGTVRLKYHDPRSQTPKPTRFEKKVFEYTWDPSEIMKYLNNMYENTSAGSAITNGSTTPKPLARSKHSSTSLKNIGMSFRSKSSTSLSQLGSSFHTTPHTPTGSSSSLSAKNNHVLVQGNYEFPFSAILPGDMPESVEGLPGASVVYKLESILERGKFHNPMVTKKHVRVVRTMTTDSVELSETVAVDNTWPQKVEYSLSVPSKAIAVGSGTPISLMLVPLLKGLRLGEIRISLVELYSYVGYLPPPYTSERVVCEKSIAAPESDNEYQMDKWQIETFLKVPPSLSKCTQDCDIQTHIKVRHKLKFNIGLCNPDGHTSELRATLPVQLFISPFVTVKARANDELAETHEVQPEPVDDDEEVVFASDPRNSLTNLQGLGESNQEALRSNPHSYSSFTGLVAPPIYEQHAYDQLWSDVSPVESPMSSGTATPRSIYSSNRGSNDVLQFSMSSIDTAQLTENLRQLSIQRQLQEGLENTMTSPAARERGNDHQNDDYFTFRRPALQRSQSLYGQATGSQAAGGMMTPVPLALPTLSRAGSDSNVLPADMSRVPSYNEAMKSGVEDTLSPAYEPPRPGSNINLEEVNKRFEESMSRSPPAPLHPNTLANSRNKLFLNRASSSLNLKTSSRNSSASSSPSGSRNVSSNSLASMGDNQSRSTKRHPRATGSAVFSMTPM